MELTDVIETVGQQRYDEACAWAWRTAARTGEAVEADPEDVADARRTLEEMPEAQWARLSDLAKALYAEAAAGAAAPADTSWPDGLEEVPHEIGDVLWSDGEDSLPASLRPERIALTFAVYRDMPCYALLGLLWWECPEFGSDQLELVFAEYRKLLESEHDELAEPVLYALWVDWFESGDEVAWHRVTVLEGDYERRIERVLRMSGPVRFALKETLYEQLRSSQRWHAAIFESIAGSTFDVYGDIDPAKGLRWISRLALPRGTEGVEQIAGALRSRVPG